MNKIEQQKIFEPIFKAKCIPADYDLFKKNRCGDYVKDFVAHAFVGWCIAIDYMGKNKSQNSA